VHTVYCIQYSKETIKIKVEAKDIPYIQKFMTEFWKAIKDFYSVELTDEYSKQATDRLIELGEYAEMCPDNNDKQFIKNCLVAFNKLLDSKQRGLIENVQREE
jgi:hypothetical protein